MDLLRVRRLFADEQVARFGMSGPGGRPLLAPVPFAVIDDGDAGVVVCTLDVEPRSLAAASRLRELTRSPLVTFLADSNADGSRRWWVQADAVAEVLRRRGDDPRFDLGVAALAERYPDLEGCAMASIVWATVLAWDSWTAKVDSAVTAA